MIDHPLTIILLASLLSVSSLCCHYSCNTCVDQDYSGCLSCNNSANTLTTMGTSNNQVYGICGTTIETSINGFGVFLLIGCIGLGLFLRSQHIFYFILSFQVLGLLSLIEIAYPFSLNTIFTAFQYFMIFSQLQSNSKHNDGMLNTRHLYRLQTFMKSVDIGSNFTPIFVISFLGAMGIGSLLIFRKCRENQCQCISNQNLEMLLTAFRTIIFMTMQQSLLIIYIGIRFDNLSIGQIVMIILYSLVIVFLLVDLNWNRMPYFRTKKLLNLAIAQRFILPVFVILPSKNTYQLIIFMVVFAAIELIFYFKSKAKTRHYVYSVLRAICCLLTGVYVAVELAVNSQASSKIAGIFATVVFGVFLVAFLVEALLSIKEKCVGGGKIENQEDPLLRANTNEKIELVREDTLEQTLGAQIQNMERSRKSSSQVPREVETLPPNLLEQPKKRQHKFRVHKND